MKYLLLLAVIINTACLDKKAEGEVPSPSLSSNNTQVSESVTPTPTPEPHECEAIGMSSDKPSAVWKMANGQELVICNLGSYDIRGPSQVRGWINIFPRPISLETRLIKAVDSERPGYFNIIIRKESDTKIEVIKTIGEEIADEAGHEANDVTLSVIDCSSKTCVIGKERCLELPKGEANLKAITHMENIASGKEKELEAAGYYDSITYDVARAALYGNKRAIKIILDENPKKYRIDGAAAESYYEGRKLIEGLIELNCMER
jgi:hypothetical protein